MRYLLLPGVVVVACLPAFAGGLAATWLDSDDAPAIATIACDPVDCSGTVTVLVPTVTYGNACEGTLAAGGTPSVIVDDLARTIELVFLPPTPSMCPDVFSPVEGISFSVSLPAAGRWRAFGENSVAAFDLQLSNPAASGEGVEWFENSSPPPYPILTCEDDDCSGVVDFRIPTATYGNACEGQQALGGTPVLSIDTDARSAELWFSAPVPADCPDIFEPVSGIDGTFSGLASGRWRFFSDAVPEPFSLQFNVSVDTAEGEVALLPGDTGPSLWSVDCDDLACSGTFDFEGPTETFSNPCVAVARSGGVPELLIDPATHTVELWFRAPTPAGCPLNVDLQTGLTGSFGPLSAGTWHFFSRKEETSFDLIAEVGNATVSWLGGTSGPMEAAVDCDTPECTGLIDFEVPSITYGNSCEANDGVGGTPVLAIDEVNKEIALFPAAPGPSACVDIFAPVTGLGGIFGPLSPGAWRFYSDPEDFDFEVSFFVAGPHSADTNEDDAFSLGELLRVVQLYNAGGFGCDNDGDPTEDGYLPEGSDTSCTAHAGDYGPQDWAFSLGELLRQIQLYNAGGYTSCEEGEDGFCAG